MKKLASAIYRGAVVHRRLRPKRHRLRYGVFNMLFDLDELPRLDRELRFFSRNRFNLFSFYDRDHGNGKQRLRNYVESLLRKHGIDLAGGPVRLLCMPRVLGYVFNPLSIYFCYRPSGKLAAILYEVNNTFGERHNYLAAAGKNPDAAVTQEADKSFHVSPFLPVDMRYFFRVTAPAESAAVSVHVHDNAGLVVAASFSAARTELTDKALIATFFGYPLLTLKVIAGIYWEAVKLWRKGLRVYSKPAPPEGFVTIGHERAETDRGVTAS